MRLIDTGPSERGAHRLDTISRCLRLYGYHLAGFDPGPRLPLTRGTMLHIALAHHYERIRLAQRGESSADLYAPEEAVQAYVAKLVARAGESKGQNDAQEVKLAQDLQPDVIRVYRQFAAYYSNDARNYEILGVERAVEGRVPGFAPTDPPLRVTQRYDLAARDRRDGRIYVIDHKGVYYPSNATLERYTLSIQFLLMQYGAVRLFGAEFGGVKVQRCGFDDPSTFKRDTIAPAPEALEGLPAAIAWREKILADAAAMFPDPKTWPMAISEQTCIGPYGKCDAYDICQWGTHRGAWRPK